MFFSSRERTRKSACHSSLSLPPSLRLSVSFFPQGLFCCIVLCWDTVLNWGGGGRTPWISPAYLLYQPFVLKDLRCSRLLQVKQGYRRAKNENKRLLPLFSSCATFPYTLRQRRLGERGIAVIFPFRRSDKELSTDPELPSFLSSVNGFREEELTKGGVFPVWGLVGGGLSNLIDMSYLVSHSTHWNKACLCRWLEERGEGGRVAE